MSIEIYANGICYCSVCAPKEMTAGEITIAVNLKNPTGTRDEWEVSSDKTFRTGESSPCPCEKKPNTHQHWLMVC
jgi:hypothetical protein